MSVDLSKLVKQEFSGWCNEHGHDKVYASVYVEDGAGKGITLNLWKARTFNAWGIKELPGNQVHKAVKSKGSRYNSTLPIQTQRQLADTLQRQVAQRLGIRSSMAKVTPKAKTQVMDGEYYLWKCGISSVEGFDRGIQYYGKEKDEDVKVMDLITIMDREGNWKRVKNSWFSPVME